MGQGVTIPRRLVATRLRITQVVIAGDLGSLVRVTSRISRIVGVLLRVSRIVDMVRHASRKTVILRGFMDRVGVIVHGVSKRRGDTIRDRGQILRTHEAVAIADSLRAIMMGRPLGRISEDRLLGQISEDRLLNQVVELRLSVNVRSLDLHESKLSVILRRGGHRQGGVIRDRHRHQ